MKNKTQNKIKIAVSGVAGSFSEEAALIYAQRCSIDPEIIYCVDMEGVLNALDKKKAAIGIFPVVNSRGGLVQTAFEAMGKHLFKFIDEIWMEVYQCLLVKKGIKSAQIKRIASHPQAISQCERYLKSNFPNAQIIYANDTAKAAEDLQKNVYDKFTAVIAPARSAIIYSLELAKKGIQDNHPNLTTFIVVTK